MQPKRTVTPSTSTPAIREGGVKPAKPSPVIKTKAPPRPLPTPPPSMCLYQNILSFHRASTEETDPKFKLFLLHALLPNDFLKTVSFPFNFYQTFRKHSAIISPLKYPWVWQTLRNQGRFRPSFQENRDSAGFHANQSLHLLLSSEKMEVVTHETTCWDFPVGLKGWRGGSLFSREEALMVLSSDIIKSVWKFFKYLSGLFCKKKKYICSLILASLGTVWT